jgi:hypothetical protein
MGAQKDTAGEAGGTAVSLVLDLVDPAG